MLRWLLTISGFGLGGLLVGCGTSDYNQHVDRGVALVRSEAKFRGLFAPVQIPDTQFMIRVPVIFTQSYTPTSSHPDDGAKINPRRMQPPFLPADDAIKLTFEGMATDGNRTLPYYCYLAAGPAKPGEVDQLMSEIQKGLKQLFPDPEPVWEPVDADTPTGKAVPWRKIRAVGEQAFFVKLEGDDKPEVSNLPGVFELWLHDAGEEVVIVAWRAPKAIEGPQTREFETTGGIAMPVSNAKPDLSKWPVLTAGTLTRSGE